LSASQPRAPAVGEAAAEGAGRAQGGIARVVLATLLLAMAAGQLADFPGFVQVLRGYEIGAAPLTWIIAIGLVFGEVTGGALLLRGTSTMASGAVVRSRSRSSGLRSRSVPSLGVKPLRTADASACTSHNHCAGGSCSKTWSSWRSGRGSFSALAGRRPWEGLGLEPGSVRGSCKEHRIFGRRKRNDRQQPLAGPAVDEVVATINDESFLASTEGGVTVVDFGASWCGPCRAFAPVFDDVATRCGARVRFARCDVDESPLIATMLQITSIPTVIAFGPDGSELGRIVGVPRLSDLEEAIAELERRSRA
jgi:thioredoxin 1